MSEEDAYLSLEDKLGSGDVDNLVPVVGSDVSGGLGVEAAAVVVITLLAVLGNAMVVATLVRRSLLHHPSNRLVLSLTGSNLILTVVVLPGMVTSLLMTPASPHNYQHFNESKKASSQDPIESVNLFELNTNITSVSNQANDSEIFSIYSNKAIRDDHGWSSSLAQKSGFSTNIDEINSTEGLVSFSSLRNEQEVTKSSLLPHYFTTTEFPVYLDVSSDVNPPPVSLYNHRDVSLLSQELQESQQIWHESSVSGEKEFHGIDQKSFGTNSEVSTSLTGEIPEKINSHHSRIKITKRRGEVKDTSSENKDGELSQLIKHELEPNQRQNKEGKEIRSISLVVHKFHTSDEESNYKSHNSDSESINISPEGVRKIDQNFPNHQRLKGFTKENERELVHQERQDILITRNSQHEDIHQDTEESHNHVKYVQEDRVRHSTIRRKQDPRHYQHRKQRLRRNMVDDENERKVFERIYKRDMPQNLDLRKEMPKLEHETKENLKGRLKVDIKSQQEGEEHVIVVQGVQEIGDHENNQMMLVVVEDEINDKHHHLHVQVEQNLGQIQHHEQSHSDINQGSENIHESSSNSDQEVTSSDSTLTSQPQVQETKQDLKLNHTYFENRTDSLLERQPQAFALRLNASRIVKFSNSEEPEEQHLGMNTDENIKKQKMYGVEWESNRWEGGRILCQGAAFFTNFVTAASALTVAVIAIDRYLAIVRPLVYSVMVTSGRCLLLLVWCWSQALLTALPPLLGWARYERREPYGRCGVAWGDSPSYTAVWTISVFLVPFTIMVVCYYQILQVARNKCQRIRVGKVSESSPPNTPDPVTTACLDGFPFPLSVAHLMTPPVGCKHTSPISSSPRLRKLSSFGNLLSPPLDHHLPGMDNGGRHWNGSSHGLMRHSVGNGTSDSYCDRVMPCRSYSVSGMLRAVDSSTNSNDPLTRPKRKLGDFGRSRSLCQVPQQPPKPCLRRVQSTFTLKKFSLGNRRPSWNWEGSPSKGFWTVFVVMGAHILSWGPYTCMAIAEAILGRERLLLLPNWVVVTCTLLLFTASVFYPIVYGLYNRNIRKELLTCLCPAWARRRGSHARRASTLPSYSGSVLDFTSLRQRSASDKPEMCHNPINGISGPIATISGTVASFGCPTPLVLMTEDDVGLPTRGYNPNLRKPSQDSGTVMIGGDDQDSDVDTPATTPRQPTTRRVSAPSVLSTVREDPHTTVVCMEDAPLFNRHHSLASRNPPAIHRKMTMLPLTRRSNTKSSLRRSRSLEKISSGDSEIIVDRNITYRSLRKKRTPSPVVRETPFIVPSTNERLQRRRGSLAPMKVVAIPEDCGLPEYSEVTDSGRGSVDSGNLSKHRILHGRGSVDSSDLAKTFSLRCRASGDCVELSKGQLFRRRGSVDSTDLALARTKRQENRDSADFSKNPATRHVSIDEGIGGDCLPEETNWE